MRRSPTLDEVGGAALYLLSDLSGAVTGEVHFVDCGYSTIAMPNLGALKTLEQAEELEAAVEKATPREAAQ
jgi:enoyl-[acyl-carrier protein] reductase I